MPNPPLRIVHVIPDFGLGGIQKGGCVLAAAMAQRGHQVTVVGAVSGPRFSSEKSGGLAHQVVGSPGAEATAAAIQAVDADVVHIHLFRFWDELIHRLAAFAKPPLVVSTPVFGRAPDDAALLQKTRTCVVGTYTFYRFCRWMGLGFDEAIARGIGYVPITPFDPPVNPLSTLDDPELIKARRRQLGIPPEAFVVGRLGRDDVGKWNDLNLELVSGLLSRHPGAYWLSIGFPAARGRDELLRRWGARFVNLPETADYRRLLEVLSSLDVQAFFSFGECFASSIAEAAGVGVPTIAMINPLRDNGQTEQVTDGVNGFLVARVDQAIDRVGELTQHPDQLRRMKQQTLEHCWQRWQRDRVADDLLALYDFWRDLSRPTPPYAELMLREAEQFAERYRPRMIDLLAGRNPFARVKWSALLAAVENETIWRAGRAVKRMIRPTPSFEIRESPASSGQP